MGKRRTARGAGDIAESIRLLSGDQKERIVPGKVLEVDEANFVCKVAPLNTKAELSDIKLKPEDATPGFFLIPEVDSVVVVALINDTDGYVLMKSAVSKIILTSSDLIQIDAANLNRLTGDNIELEVQTLLKCIGPEMELLGNADTAVKFSALKTAFDELKSDFNTLVSTFNSHVHSGVIVSVSGGSGAPAVGVPGNSAAPTSSGQNSSADISPAEDPTVKLGS